MYYHASPVEGIKQLEPRVSDHHIPLVYFSTKRENTLVYLSNAIQKYCKETGFNYDGIWKKWGPYGFAKDGIQQLQEYYPNAIEKTYKGVSGYIYSAESITDSGFETQIPNAASSNAPVTVVEILLAKNFEKNKDEAIEWLKRSANAGYNTAYDMLSDLIKEKDF